MPQISIEYSANLAAPLAVEPFARSVHERVVQFADAELANCKTRLVELDRYLISDGASRNAMVHVDLRILPGRTDEQKRQLGEAVIAALEDAVSGIEGFDLQLTAEVRELDGPNYHKRRISR